jgi:fatty-acyl-CoA synthase
VALRPDGVALVDGVADASARRRWTYRGLQSAGTKVAAALGRRFAPGDHVALWSPNSADWVLFQIGAGLAGVVLVTVNPAYQDAELADVLRRSGARGLFYASEHHGRDLARIAQEAAVAIPSIEVTGSLADLLAEAEAIEVAGDLPRVDADAIAQIQYTSGTTGFPKGAMLMHGGISTACDQVIRRALPGAEEAVTYLNPMPLFHIGGSGVATVGTLAHAGTQVVMPRFDVDLWLSLVEAERATVTMAVPTMLIAILEHPSLADHDLGSLRTILTGGAYVPRELVQRAHEQLGADVLITFGQTESHGTMCTTRRHDSADDISTTVGLPLDHVEVAIADPASGEIVEVGAAGEILVRGNQVMAGYFSAPDETSAAIDEDGWLHFGDLGTMDERGYLRVIGRLKDMVIRGGENIYPREIEDVLARHPSIAEVAVVGVPDDAWGEEVAAVIRLQPELGQAPDPGALRDWCRDRLAHYKSPRLWFYVSAFPLTASGKIQKHRIVESIVEQRIRPAGSFVRKLGKR